MKINKQNRKGFTLVELLVVIAIIGVLAAMAIPRFTNASASARGAKIIADLRTIDSAVSLYYAQYGAYPSSIDTLSSSSVNLLATSPTPNASSAMFNGHTRNITTQTYSISSTTGRAYLGSTATNTAEILAASSADTAIP